MALLSTKNLLIGYEKKPVTKEITFSVGKGDYICIVGENGSGKTTLMKTLLNLQAPLGGIIEFGDGLSQNEIGYLPQQTEVQRDFPASVREIVLSGCQSHLRYRAFYSRKEKQLAFDNMKRMGIEHLSNRCYRELSGGQQQRVLLARALCATKKLLVLDEPVSGLDPNATYEMYKLVKDLNNEGISIMMITHDVEDALSYCTHVLHIGNTVFFGNYIQYRETMMNHMYAYMDKEGKQ